MIKLLNLITEKIVLDVKVGDVILTGRFKNKKVVVKSIGKDEHGMPTINGKKVEIAVKNIVNGEEVENIVSISNSECLNEFSTIMKKNRQT